jgi:hypothetical protein
VVVALEGLGYVDCDLSGVLLENLDVLSIFLRCFMNGYRTQYGGPVEQSRRNQLIRHSLPTLPQESQKTVLGFGDAVRRLGTERGRGHHI